MLLATMVLYNVYNNENVNGVSIKYISISCAKCLLFAIGISENDRERSELNRILYYASQYYACRKIGRNSTDH